VSWTLFWDMHSGGGLKEEWAKIYIEAPMEEAKVIFYNRFGHNPERITCSCCGPDYSIAENETLKEASAYHRGCLYDRVEKKWIEKWERGGFYSRYVPLEEYVKQSDVLIIYDKDIQPYERLGSVPRQGYVWIDEGEF
jgi:hypothetical protein